MKGLQASRAVVVVVAPTGRYRLQRQQSSLGNAEKNVGNDYAHVVPGRSKVHG